MSTFQIQGGSFCELPHSYLDDSGAFIPSLTQVIKLQGLSNFDGANPDDMETASLRGTALHELVQTYNQEGDYDPNWLTPDIEGYFTGYRAFLKDTNFVPDPSWVERPLIATIRGMKVGMKLDMFGQFGRDRAVVEIKAASSKQDSWSIQTAMQELGVHGSNHVGRVRRFALQLMKTGKYKLWPHEDHARDEHIGLSALALVWWRLDHGQKLWEKV